MKGTAVGELRGRIVKGVGGFYYVNAGGTLYECKARGKFRVENMTPMVGDEVLFAPEEGKPKGYLSEILPRKNAMLRPPVSNVDQFVLVLSASVPRADFLLADKLLVQAEREKVLPLVCINKCDEADEELLGQIRNDYGSREMGFLMVSARTGEGFRSSRSGFPETELLCRPVRCGKVLAAQRPGRPFESGDGGIEPQD